MMFIVRSRGASPAAADVVVKVQRQTPAIVAQAADEADFFCLGDEAAMQKLRAAGWQVVELRDGYYEDGRGGGVAIWGQGRYWEIRAEPLTVTEAAGPAGDARDPAPGGEQVNVRGAIFGA